ncbi:hypothetical protein I3F58_15820 [Streptomyces sp. MUM 203J]|uniref:hypothetical protein n=1 Tax=Streptomyces sp. MUM 203J TaxID=2791990 RepID=UPI001F04C488|nr:hypothetical protein [Streptomyces sp. MUM 203J]MCH0541012.1 hypothetical protein [Streptomyces sp. MUM 203J]
MRLDLEAIQSQSPENPVVPLAGLVERGVVTRHGREETDLPDICRSAFDFGHQGRR